MSSPHNYKDADDAELISCTLFRFKRLPEDAQLQMIEEASDEVGDQVVISRIEKLPKESEEEFRIRRFTELLKNLPKDSLLKFTTAASTVFLRYSIARKGHRFKVKTLDLGLPLNPELFKVTLPNLRGAGAGASGAGGTLGEGEGKK